ncbi:hypothetical protein CURTO8I2_160083 [Curtobacterium sp. 8I-2]|nr:hypothetical protein CURTO8I2_160083 [Curtobacterium sp. 8I-2]
MTKCHSFLRTGTKSGNRFTGAYRVRDDPRNQVPARSTDAAPTRNDECAPARTRGRILGRTGEARATTAGSGGRIAHPATP